MSEHVINQHMGITHKDFFRLLPVALGSRDYDVQRMSVCWKHGDQTVDIQLGEEGVRKIALLAIPVTEVTIRLSGYDEDDARAFMVQFDRAYQRGGG